MMEKRKGQEGDRSVQFSDEELRTAKYFTKGIEWEFKSIIETYSELEQLTSLAP